MGKVYCFFFFFCCCGCSLVIFDYSGVCLPASFNFKTGSFERWGINLRNMILSLIYSGFHTKNVG